MMKIKIHPSVSICVITLSLARLCQADEGLTLFENEIRPLLIKHCYECHSADAKKLKANLFLDSRAGWQLGGDSGPAIVPGKPHESLLFETVSVPNSDLQMPPKTRLSDREVDSLRTWIEMGAPDPREGQVNREYSEIDIEKGREFWAFKPPVNHTAPNVEDSEWPNNDIDRFVLAKLEAKGIEPLEAAPRRTLLRRIYFDLIGLPPSPGEINHFINDSSVNAFEKVVDNLLARPEFGERWGRHWLDVARYAESSGGGRSMIFPDAWRFRDYVIDSFNQDKPYNRFIREHLAGDVMPYGGRDERNANLVGSGYLVLGAINYELQDQELLRMEVVDEQVDTLGRTFLGMSLGCARCHDHKFDPIPTTDYYALAGIFQSTNSLGTGEAAADLSAVATRQLEFEGSENLIKLQRSLDDIQKELLSLNHQLGRTKGSIDRREIPGIVVDSTEAKITGDWASSTTSGAWIGENYIHDSGEGKGANEVEFSIKIPESKNYDVYVSYSSAANRDKSVPVTIQHAGGESTVKIDQTRSAPILGCFIHIGSYPFTKDAPAIVTISNKGTSGVVSVDAVVIGAPGPKATVVAQKKEARIKELKKKQKEIADQITKLDQVAMAPSEGEILADGHVHIRGQVRNKGQKVSRGFLTVAMKPGDSASIAKDSSGRLELADWIASSENPLTARVFVNRVWKYLLGEGIVCTPDDFGQTGELPSHPELLDFLALQFVDQGWSIKKLIREIVLSHTYQLASGEYHELDPENRLFSRANRKRLEAESIRDTFLLVSGQLDPTRGGLTIRKLGKYDKNYEFDTNRRSVYVPWFRNSMLDVFEVFDAPNPNLVVGQRSTTNLPTQSLFLMNSGFIRKQSELTAKRLMADGAKIEDAYQLILGRLPSVSEAATIEAFFDRFDSEAQEEAWTQICHTLFSCIDFRFLD